MTMRLRLVRQNPVVGDVALNAAYILKHYYEALNSAHPVDLLVFSECFLSGYPPQDLLHRDDFIKRLQYTLQEIAEHTHNHGVAIVLGTPYWQDNTLHNSAVFIDNGHIHEVSQKILLPNDHVFDEPRVFSEGTDLPPFLYKGVSFGVMICEDMWHPQRAAWLCTQKAQVLLSLNASPFSAEKPMRRRRIIEARVQETGLPMAAVFQVGGQDQLWFDGGNVAINPDGVAMQAPHSQAGYDDVELQHVANAENAWRFKNDTQTMLPHRNQGIYDACVGGLRDFVHKNGLRKAILGLSGGIDSALTACMAVDALGADNVQGLILPSRFTARDSITDAEELAKNLNITTETIAIEPLVNNFRQAVSFTAHGVVDENLQARVRGILLMAYANAHNAMLLSTGNKSELAMGYATLYGDMCGGFNPLKDLYKTQVYDIAYYRNGMGIVIPENIFSKAPTAELRDNQTDQDTLPAYGLLDKVLQHILEKNGDIHDLRDQVPDDVLLKIETMLYRAEYKRHQAAPGVRVSECLFGYDRRFAITNGFRSLKV